VNSNSSLQLGSLKDCVVHGDRVLVLVLNAQALGLQYVKAAFPEWPSVDVVVQNINHGSSTQGVGGVYISIPLRDERQRLSNNRWTLQRVFRELLRLLFIIMLVAGVDLLFFSHGHNLMLALRWLGITSALNQLLDLLYWSYRRSLSWLLGVQL